MSDSDRLTRWRLVLGGDEADGIGGKLTGEHAAMDKALASLYDAQNTDRRGGLGKSSPYVARWLGDIRKYFPRDAVTMLQRDAIERLDLKRLLLEPELLDDVEPDVHLVGTLLSLKHLIPSQTKESARRVVRKVVEEVEKRLAEKMKAAVRGAIDRTRRTRRPRANEIDWDRTIRANLSNYLPEHKVIVPERLVGHAHKQRRSLHDIVLCVDQSGSMAPSVVYSAIFGAVLASLSSVRTQMVVFDTAVVDLTEDLEDPVDLLFGTQLGGGTDIHAALTYCSSLVSRPEQTVMVLITDLYEGGSVAGMMRRAADLVASGVNVICLLALSDEGAPFFDARNAAAFDELGIPCFGCTPDLFPDLIAAAIQRDDIAQWAARHDVILKKGG